jgi:hypothetical protein
VEQGPRLQDAHPPQHQARREPSFGQPIFAYDPTSNGATDYRKLALEMIEAFEGVAPVAPPPPAREDATDSIESVATDEVTGSTEGVAADDVAADDIAIEPAKPAVEVTLHPDVDALLHRSLPAGSLP